MRVVRTPVKNRPSKRRSRATRARSQVRHVRVRAASLTERRAYHGDDVRKRRDSARVRRLSWSPSMSSPSSRYFHGWNVVGATVLVAFFSFGLGFYGIAVYVASLQHLHGWSAATVSAPVTVYYVA